MTPTNGLSSEKALTAAKGYEYLESASDIRLRWFTSSVTMDVDAVKKLMARASSGRMTGYLRNEAYAAKNCKDTVSAN